MPARTRRDAGVVDDSAASRLARYYDLDMLDAPPDVPRLLALAEAGGDPILEFAAGTGRLAIPLALAGHEVVAVDVDPAMLARADAAWAKVRGSAASGGRLTLVDGDLLTVELGPRFAVVLLGLNSLFLLATRERQAATLVAMARHLRPNGTAIVDVWLPHPDDLAVYDGRQVFEWQRDDPETGERVAKVHSARHDSATGEVELTAWFDAWPPAGGPVRRVGRTDRLRLVSSGELVAMAEAAGLTVESIEGDHDGSPFGLGAERAVLRARLV